MALLVLPNEDETQRLNEAREKILPWFYKNRRELPWRISPEQLSLQTSEFSLSLSELQSLYPGMAKARRDPYRTWISETMLQQTQVATVINHYLRWMKRFPTVQSLAESQVEDVLQYWQGLGYYSRARNLHKSAIIIKEEFSGRFPITRQKMLGLPGVGEYTAGAVLSLSFDFPEAILDGNVFRVFSRLLAWNKPLINLSNKQEFWSAARLWSLSKSPGDVNEALMELGALICKPKNPLCNSCPLNEYCLAYSQQLQQEYPSPKLRKETVKLFGRAWVISSGTQVLLRQARAGELLAGLWNFPITWESIPFNSRAELNDSSKNILKFSPKSLALNSREKKLQESWMLNFSWLPSVQMRSLFERISHSITHHAIDIQVVDVRFESELDEEKLLHYLPDSKATEYAWYPVNKLSEYLVSSLPSKILRLWQKGDLSLALE